MTTGRGPMRLMYAVIFEQTRNGYGASVPDVPGCVSAGDSWDETREMIRDALGVHIEDMLEQGEPLPEPKMSISDAVALHDRAGHTMEDRRVAMRFEIVEVEASSPGTARAG